MKTSLNKQETLWGSIYALLHFFGIPVLLAYAGAFLRLPDWALTVCSAFLLGICTLIIYRRFLKKSFQYTKKSILKLLLHIGLWLIVYYISGFVISLGIFTIYPDYFNINDGVVAGQLTQGGILMVLAVAVATPIGEEAIFRGLLFRGLYDSSPFLAWCVSVGLFSLVHIIGYIGIYSPIAFILAFLQYLPAGLCLCLGYRLSGSFFCPVLIHCIINFVSIVVML